MRRVTMCLPLLLATAALAQEYRIAGRMVNALSGSPLAGAVVAISIVDEGSDPPPAPRERGRGPQGGPPPPGNSGRSVIASVTTVEDGYFAFEHLPANKYSLLGSKRGYLSAAYDEHSGFSTAIVTGPRLTSEGLQFKLSPGAVIAGTVSDASGDAIEQASVILFRQQDDGLGAVKQFRTANADDAGNYEFTHVPAGTYFLGVNGRVWYAAPPSQEPEGKSPSRDLDVVYPMNFYPDTTDSAAATPIPIKGGEHLSVDLPLHAVPAAHITVSLAPPRGEGRNDGQERSFPTATQKAFGEPLTVRPPEGFGPQRGGDRSPSVTFSVAPGQYQVEMEGHLSNVDASGDTHFDPSGGAALVTVSGKIALVHGGVPPEGSSLVLRRVGSSTQEERTELAADGTFTLERVQPDAYEVEVHGDSRLYAVAQMAATGAQVRGSVVQIGSEPTTLAATVAPASSRVTGFVKLDGKGHGGAMVVLVPKRGGERGLYRRDQSDSDGSFVLRDVAPGEYTVIAIDNGWDLEWARASVTARYLAAGVAVQVGEAAKVVMKADVAPQPR